MCGPRDELNRESVDLSKGQHGTGQWGRRLRHAEIATHAGVRDLSIHEPDIDDVVRRLDLAQRTR